jgi:O-antigen/teichoic acid export membrane protein
MLSFSIIKNFLIYSAGNILLRCITAGTSFIAITFLTPKEFGLLALLNNFIAITPIFLNLGLRQGYFLEYCHINKAQQKEMLHHIIFIYLTLAIPVIILAIASTGWINKTLFLGEANSKLILTALAICFIHFFVELLLQVFRYQTKSSKLIILQSSMAIITLLGNILLVYFFQLKTWGILLGNLIGMLSIAIFGMYQYLKKVCHTHYPVIKSWGKTKYYLKLGLPFIPNIIFYWILTSSDRWILARLSGLEDVGIYSLADSFCQLFHLLILYPLSASYIPDMLEKFSKLKNQPAKLQDLEKQNLKLMWIFMALACVAIVVGFVASKQIFYWLIPTKYHAARNFILILLLGQVFYMGTYFSTIRFIYLKQPKIILWTTFIAASTNIFLNLILTPYFGLYGCTWATFISFGLMFFLSLVKLNITF